LPQEDSTRCERRAEALLWLAELTLEDAFFFDCFFLTVRFVGVTRFTFDAFFACFEVAAFDFARFLFVFLFLDGIAAVYHRVTRPPQYHRDPAFLYGPVSPAMRRKRSLWLGLRTVA